MYVCLHVCPYVQCIYVCMYVSRDVQYICMCGQGKKVNEQTTKNIPLGQVVQIVFMKQEATIFDVNTE